MSNPPHNQTYTCEVCGKTCKSAWTEEEALVELEIKFPEARVEDCALVCDDCYKEFIEWMEGES